MTALAEVGARIEGLDVKIGESANAVAAARNEQTAAEAALDSARSELATDQALEERVAMGLETRRRSLEWQRGRQQEFLQERSKAAEERQILAAQVQALDTDADDARAEVHRLRRELDQFSLEELQAQVAYWSTRAAVTEQSVGNVRRRRSEHEAAVQSTGGRKNEIESRIADTRNALRQAEAEKIALLERQRTLLDQFETLQSRIIPAQSELEGAEEREGSLDEAEITSQRNASAAERTVSQSEIDLVRRQEALDSLRARITDDFGLVSFEYASNVEGPVPLPFEGLVEELPAVSTLGPEIEEQLIQRRARLRRLGLVNPEAAKEFEAEAERYSFMSAQIRDLRQAEEDLRQVIAELDELTRREFSRTYAAVDKQFRTIFTRLFGGGSAHLELTDPDNLVETGIEIEARLPGRREQGLALLSGGERSLTAIALVCALLKVSPTPVCVMDEVDAMLDEANVGRFRDLLTELSQETQFIIITHNRNTVQAADFIYGVTMGRDSTSQIISLKLDEVSEEMLGSSKA
jgi:chromosome segregation protein